MTHQHQEHAHAHGEVVHHELSASPLLIGIGALITYIGMVGVGQYSWGIPVAVFGFLFMGFAFAMWISEDMKKWATHALSARGKHIDWHGMMYFLGTEIMLFGSLFFTYFYSRSRHEPFDLPVTLTGINTLILIASGFTLHWGLHGIQKNNRTTLKIGLLLTLLLGGTFLAIQAYEYIHLVEEGFTLSSGSLASIFYMMTGTHGVHVFLGLLMLGVVTFRAFRNQFDAERHIAVETFSIYWHFVDIVWILLYLIVYVGVV